MDLTATEYDLLAENAGRVVTHEELLQRVWGPVNPGSPRTIRTHLMRLRHKPGEDGENPTYVFAEPRVGYRMAVGEGAEGRTISYQHIDWVHLSPGQPY